MTIENKEIYRLYKCVKYDKTRNQFGLYFEGFVGGITVYATDGRAIFKKTFYGNNKDAFTAYFNSWQIKNGETLDCDFVRFGDKESRNLLPKIKCFFDHERFNEFTVDYKEFRQAFRGVDTVNIGRKTEFSQIIISGKDGKISLASWNEDASGTWQLDGDYEFNGAISLARNYLDVIRGGTLAFSCSKDHSSVLLHIQGEYECIIMPRIMDAEKFLEVFEYEYAAPEKPAEAADAMNCKRNIYIPKMTVNRLERLLKKADLTGNDKENLLDYKYFILNDKQSAVEKGFLIPVGDSGASGYVPRNKFWIANIDYKTQGFESRCYAENPAVSKTETAALKTVKPEKKPALTKAEKERAYWTAKGWTYNEKKFTWQKACNW